MYDEAEDYMEITLKDIKVSQKNDELFEIEFVTSLGTNKGILHHREGNKACTVLVGGAGGGFDGPASIYKEIGPDLLDKGISSLRLDFTRPAYLEESVMDTLIGIEFHMELGIDMIGLAGWSFGGAVVINAGVINDDVQCVVTIASQTYGTESVDQLSPKSLLAIHGTADKTLPPACSQDIYNRAKEPKELVLYEGGNHGIDQKRDEVLRKVEDFFIKCLGE